MTEPVKIITFGGAKFDENQIASKSTVKKNGQTHYIINFKSGAKVEYPKQAQKNNAAIDFGRGESEAYVGTVHDGTVSERMYNQLGEGAYKDLIGGEGVVYQKADKYTISRFFGLEFTGTQKPDDVNLKGCNNCTVKISGGNSKSGDKVCLENDKNFISKNNEVLMDSKDIVYQNNPDGFTNQIEGAGTYHEGDSRDKLR